MRKAILILLMSMMPFQYNTSLHEALDERKFIKENNLELVTLSCYTSTGNKNASGKWPTEGTCACNTAHLGMDAVIYNEDFIPIDRLHCEDVGGNILLRQGRAIDVYRDSYERCVQYIKEHPKKIYIQWIDHDYEGELPVPDYIERLGIDTD